jgi:ureidoglycolate hydrolase
MSEIIILPKPIDEASFAPFGQVLNSPGESPRHDHAAEVANQRDEAAINVAVVRALPAKLPLQVSALERHPFSSQSFFPLDVGRYLIAVATADGDKPDLAGLQAFIVDGSTAINYAPGVWHHPLQTLDDPGTFALLMWEDGGPRDTDWHQVEGEVRIEIGG